jgi:hypothetical protein
MKKHVSVPATFLMLWKSRPISLAKPWAHTFFVFVHLHKMTIFEDIACVVVNDGANEVNGGERGWSNSFQEDAFSRKCIPKTK